jgi:spore coat polysaccharide biosynthesis protein SpsF
MKIVATIEARMSSSRMPGKVLRQVMGEPLLGHLIRRLRAVGLLSEIVLATTTNPADDVLAAFARDTNVRCFRGSETDVLGRVAAAAESVAADLIVETTGDNPIIDPDIIDTVLRTYLANAAAYVSNTHVKSFPDGMDVQVFSLETLRRSAAATMEPLDREHVTLHIRNHPEIFRPIHVIAPAHLRWPELAVTVDEPADFELVRRIIEALAPKARLFGCAEVVDLVRKNPSWRTLNQTVIRKGDS